MNAEEFSAHYVHQSDKKPSTENSAFIATPTNHPLPFGRASHTVSRGRATPQCVDSSPEGSVVTHPSTRPSHALTSKASYDVDMTLGNRLGYIFGHGVKRRSSDSEADDVGLLAQSLTEPLVRFADLPHPSQMRCRKKSKNKKMDEKVEKREQNFNMNIVNHLQQLKTKQANRRDQFQRESLPLGGPSACGRHTDTRRSPHKRPGRLDAPSSVCREDEPLSDEIQATYKGISQKVGEEGPWSSLDDRVMSAVTDDARRWPKASLVDDSYGDDSSPNSPYVRREARTIQLTDARPTLSMKTWSEFVEERRRSHHVTKSWQESEADGRTDRSSDEWTGSVVDKNIDQFADGYDESEIGQNIDRLVDEYDESEIGQNIGHLVDEYDKSEIDQTIGELIDEWAEPVVDKNSGRSVDEWDWHTQWSVSNSKRQSSVERRIINYEE